MMNKIGKKEGGREGGGREGGEGKEEFAKPNASYLVLIFIFSVTFSPYFSYAQ